MEYVSGLVDGIRLLQINGVLNNRAIPRYDVLGEDILEFLYEPSETLPLGEIQLREIPHEEIVQKWWKFLFRTSNPGAGNLPLLLRDWLAEN